ncbi:DUF2254 domain-containing protein [Stieleria sp. JC731]|uniref:DUF2254 domain-containing protein n=1 Tax=Pirellulaceae TaxID=2691357 RepID=UPI001E2D4964|nr:DUF2254 domain-containing protein [Stieleria sp. JC731]MCC9601742.1 DUF2254 domain-containing protein [Stieleria sp. JC731]
MRAKLQQIIYRISGSYWFVPTMMAIASLIASRLSIAIDRSFGSDWIDMFPAAALNQPEGARALLATVAGSMITVAGVTFSLTMVAVSHATSHYGPRLLDNIMRDRGNQITLGTFVATFLFCLMILRTVRSGQPDGAEIETTLFVPHLSTLIAFILTLASVGVLIYFIHHIPESIHISNVLGNISKMLEAKVDELFPEKMGDPKEERPRSAIDWESAFEIASDRAGYLQGIDQTGLIDYASERDLIVKLLVRPGGRILLGQPIAQIIPSDPPHLSDDRHGSGFSSQDEIQECTDGFLACLAIGTMRTPTQDLFFILHQYVEIAVRALSPGVNDPFTAIQCIDQLANALVLIDRRSLPSVYRVDKEERLRVVTADLTWEMIIGETITVLRPYAESDPNVKQHLAETISTIKTVVKQPELIEQLEQIQSQLTAWEQAQSH